MTASLTATAAMPVVRRWVVTGTPAPGGAATEVGRLLPLLTFLHYDPYGTAAGRRLWEVHSSTHLARCSAPSQCSCERLHAATWCSVSNALGLTCSNAQIAFQPAAQHQSSVDTVNATPSLPTGTWSSALGNPGCCRKPCRNRLRRGWRRGACDSWHYCATS